MRWLFIIAMAVFTYCLVQMVLLSMRIEKLTVEKRLNEIKHNNSPVDKQSRKSQKNRHHRFGFLHISQSMKDDILLSEIGRAHV